MRTAENIDRRLREWAAWFNAGGSAVGGWPVKNILHPSWLPPSAGSLVVLPARVGSDARARQVHRAIGMLSDKLIAALVVRYCKRWSVAAQAQELGCGEAALHARVVRAQGRLAELLAED